MKMRPFDFALVLWLGALAGCTTVTFKRGASPDTMAADERACREASTDDAGYAECMRKRGAFAAGTSAAREPTATTTPVAEPSAPAGASPTATHPAGRPAPAAASAPAGALNAPVAPTKAEAPAAAVAPPAADPLARVEVGSWWKLGGTASGLESTIDACVEKLGGAHRPNPGATVVTAGLRDCLRAAGWYPLKQPASP